MRKISQDIRNAIKTKENFSGGSTTVNYDSGLKVYLHGNLIAYTREKSLFICDCDYRTGLTKNRLNLVLESFNLPIIKTVEGRWVIDGYQWRESIPCLEFKIGD